MVMKNDWDGGGGGGTGEGTGEGYHPQDGNTPPPRTAARLGPPVPLLWGTDRFRATAIYAGAIRYSDGNYWVRVRDDSTGAWGLERTDTVPAVLAICEAAATGSISIVKAWREGVQAATPADVLVGWQADNPTASEWALTATPSSPAFLTGSAIGSAWQGITQFRAQYLAMPGRKIPPIEFEATCLATSGNDAAAASVVLELLTHGTRGLGITDAVDVLTGTDGNTASGYSTYCSNAGFVVSRAVTEQTPTKELLQGILDATNSTIVRSGDRLKVVPLCEDTVGFYVPASTGVTIDDNELLHETGRDTVTVEMKPDERVYNCFPVTIRDRLYDYRENTFEYIEPAHAAEHGVRRAPRRYMPWIKTAAHALKISAILARRSISIRRTFRFRLSPRWIALEPGDLIALTHAKLGLVAEPVRIVAIEEDSSGRRELWCDEWPAGLSAIQDLTPETQDGLLSVAPNPYLEAQAAMEEAATKANVDLTNVTAGSVTESHLDTGAVTETKIDDAAVTGPKVADAAVSGQKLRSAFGRIGCYTTGGGLVFVEGTPVNLAGATRVVKGAGWWVIRVEISGFTLTFANGDPIVQTTPIFVSGNSPMFLVLDSFPDSTHIDLMLYQPGVGWVDPHTVWGLWNFTLIDA
jgi:hypothetical protein